MRSSLQFLPLARLPETCGCTCPVSARTTVRLLAIMRGPCPLHLNDHRVERWIHCPWVLSDATSRGRCFVEDGTPEDIFVAHQAFATFRPGMVHLTTDGIPNTCRCPPVPQYSLGFTPHPYFGLDRLRAAYVVVAWRTGAAPLTRYAEAAADELLRPDPRRTDGAGNQPTRPGITYQPTQPGPFDSGLRRFHPF